MYNRVSVSGSETKVKSRYQFRNLYLMGKMSHTSKESIHILIIRNSLVLVSYNIGPKVSANLGLGFGIGPKLN